MSSIRKVAEDAGVSIATVSRVINNQKTVARAVRDRVLQSVNRCGYVPSVSRRSTNLVGLVYLGQSALGSPYDSALIQGMADAMEGGTLDLVILNVNRDRLPDETFTQYFLRKGVRGAIVRATAGDRAHCGEMFAELFPVVVLGDHFDHPTANFIYSDSRPTSYQGVEHLIALGHTRIAFASSDREDAEHADRREGYLAALEDSGLTADPKLQYSVPAHRLDGAQLIRNLMSTLEPPTAIYIVDPLVAVGAINEAHNMGIRIPDDLSILGFDDTDVRNNVYPRLTAVCQDARQIGFEAFTALASLISNGVNGEPCRVIRPTWLEINGTTGEAPSKPSRILPDGRRVTCK